MRALARGQSLGPDRGRDRVEVQPRARKVPAGHAAVYVLSLRAVQKEDSVLDSYFSLNYVLLPRVAGLPHL